MVTSLTFVTLFIILPVVIISQVEQDVGYGCVKYPATPYSSFNKWNVFVVYPRRHPDMLITNVQVVRREFYRCQMTQKGVEVFFYGTNGTHYWVERGCAGDFIITECLENKPDQATGSRSGVSGGFKGVSATSLLQSLGNTFDDLKKIWKNIS